jgi:hypothetical protein
VLLLLVDEIQHDVIVGEIEIVFFLASIFFSLFFAGLSHIFVIFCLGVPALRLCSELDHPQRGRGRPRRAPLAHLRRPFFARLPTLEGVVVVHLHLLLSLCSGVQTRTGP